LSILQTEYKTPLAGELGHKWVGDMGDYKQADCMTSDGALSGAIVYWNNRSDN
jgi:hypothetical protein